MGQSECSFYNNLKSQDIDTNEYFSGFIWNIGIFMLIFALGINIYTSNYED